MRRPRFSGMVPSLCLVLLIGLFAGLTLSIGRDFSRPQFQVLPGMVDTVAYDAYDPNPVFDDGKTLREPVEGTVPRGRLPLRFGPGEEEELRAGRELTNPVHPTDAALERGARVFEIFCTACHGVSGDGDGPVTTRGFPPPTSLRSPRITDLADGNIFHIVTHGKGNMPAYAAQIGVEDRWRVIHWVRQLQGASPSPGTEEGAAP